VILTALFGFAQTQGVMIRHGNILRHAVRLPAAVLPHRLSEGTAANPILKLHKTHAVVERVTLFWIRRQ
jgi:hypothetical protein